MKPLFRGSCSAMITPFRGGEVDLPALRKLIQAQLDGGTAALVACGTTGEPSTLTLDEQELVIRETVKAVNGKIPVICGTGSNCTRSVIENEQRFRDLGCAAQLVVTPYYNKTTQEGLYAHFMEVADKTRLPIIAYNVPSRTNLELSPEVLAKLADTGRFVGLKESSYQLPLVMERLDAVKGKITLYGGNDDMVYPMLALGAEGTVSVFSDIHPRMMANLMDAWFSGNSKEALRIQLKMLPLVRALFREVSPIPAKYALERMGLCCGELRLPLVEASSAVKAEMDLALKDLELI